MPVLPQEPNAYPADLFAAGRDVAAERVWWVLHTRARQEKSLARHLHQARAPFYLPLIARRGLQRGRVLTSYVPLFPGYVFLLGRRDERLVALTSNRVVQAAFDGTIPFDGYGVAVVTTAGAEADRA